MTFKETIKKYWLGSLIILIFLGAWFYWFEWRPTQLIKACQLWSMDRVASVSGDRDDAKYFYEKCLRENGIDR
jgi:ABC-type nickel/cobalt efflux system permease component RcnA